MGRKTKYPATEVLGKKFGRLTINNIIRKPLSGELRSFCECSCECGKSVTTLVKNVAGGHTKSCGCLFIEAGPTAHKTHGASRSNGLPNRAYRSWVAMKSRCSNPKHVFYNLYGGHGITICTEWIGSFEAFYRDMGYPPSIYHTIDREDPNGNYNKDNCRWATKTEQALNRRKTS